MGQSPGPGEGSTIAIENLEDIVVFIARKKEGNFQTYSPITEKTQALQWVEHNLIRPYLGWVADKIYNGYLALGEVTSFRDSPESTMVSWIYHVSGDLALLLMHTILGSGDKYNNALAATYPDAISKDEFREEVLAGRAVSTRDV